MSTMVEFDKDGWKLCVPVVAGPGLKLVFREWRPGVRLVAGGFGTSIPEEGEELDPSILIVPLVAFDRSLFRLGYGGGFYDRTIRDFREKNPRLVAIGFAFADQEVPRCQPNLTMSGLMLS